MSLAIERGLETLSNGRLLDAVEAKDYEVFLTTDKGIPFQQNLAGISFAIVIVPANWPEVKQRLALIQRAIEQTPPGECVMVSISGIHPPRAKTKGSE